MRIVLISLQKDIEVLGLKFLHYSLLKKGYESQLLLLPTFNPDDTSALRQIRDFIGRHPPLFIGLSLMSVEYINARRLTQFLKESFPSTPVMWGGIHPTIAPEESLGSADYICIGEGEKAVADFADALRDGRQLRDTRNICFLENGVLQKNPLYPLIEDLDSIPFYDHIPTQSYIQVNAGIIELDRQVFSRYARYLGKTYSVMGSRGCPLACSYCCNNFLSGLYGTRKIRRRSVSNIIAELEQAVVDNPGLEYINFQDDCFLAGSAEYLAEFSRLYKTRIGKPFICRGIPTFVKQDKMEILKDAGLAWISIGLQSGSDRILRDVYKRNSFRADFLKAAEVTHNAKVAVYYDVILDNPFETEEDLLETIETLMKTPRPCFTQMFSLTFYIGTEIFQRTQREHPEAIESSFVKNYHAFSHNVLNRMTKIAVYLPARLMRRVVVSYKKDPHSLSFRTLLAVGCFFSTFVFEPSAYFRTIKLSQGGSLWRALKILPSYVEEGLNQYLTQFRFARKEQCRNT